MRMCGSTICGADFFWRIGENVQVRAEDTYDRGSFVSDCLST